MKKCLGLSFVELLIAMFLGLLLTAIVGHVYLRQTEHYQYAQALAHLQENAQLASDVLRSEIRMAGYIGCPRLSESFPLRNHTETTHVSLAATNVIHGMQEADGNDSISIQKGVGDADLLALSSSNQLLVSKHERFHPGDILLLSDCTKAELLSMQSVQQESFEQILVVAPAPMAFHEHAQVNRLLHLKFFVRAGELHMRNELNHDDEALIDGVEQMLVSYGVSSEQSGDVNQSVAASAVSDWSKVSTVRIALLLSSANEVLAHPMQYTFADQTRLAPDKRLYLPWVIDIGLRERQG